MSYVIKSHFRNYGTGPTLSFSEYTLGEDLKWYTACDRPVAFQTIAQARNFAEKNRIVENRPQLGSDTCPFIVSKRGRHSIFKR